MLLLLIAHTVAALVAPALIARFGRRVFVLLAAVPASAALWALSHTASVAAGDGPVSTISWIPSLGLDLSFGLDSLSWLLVLMVGGIGAGVHVYCSRYFSSRSTGLGRFAAVLVAFAGAMLGLVTSANLILIFVFWELTTVFSYLLIGHYSDRVSSRRAAMKAILVTTLGGMAMLVGVVMLGAEAGSFYVPHIVDNPPMTTPALVAVTLMLVGAVSKSALIPFHFWLPAAMAAPTPVSAYLHAAAMVKAGVYLVGRFAPAYSTSTTWQVTVTVLGITTFVFGGYLAFRQHDLKLILAFGTVSQLGLLIVLLGAPYKSVALGGMALLGAHAMFKACLFLTVGVIDAATGTRDIRRLSGLGRKMPAVAIITALATASMIGLVPFSGYVAKEATLEALLDPALTATTWKVVVVAAFAIGSALTVAYGIRLWWGAFATKADDRPAYPIVVTSPPLLLIGPPAVLAVAGLATALLPNLGEFLLAPFANTYPLGSPGHLALWGGWTPALALTGLILIVGVIAFFARDWVRWVPGLPGSWHADSLYRHTLRRIDNFAGDVTAVLQRGSLPFYLGVILVVTTVLVGGVILVYADLPDLTLGWAPGQAAISALIVVSTILAARARRRLKAVILAGITGYGAAMVFLLYGAPDLALTQALVETVTLVVFVLVMRRLPVYFSNRPLAATRWVRVTVGSMVGILFGALALIVPQTRIHEPISRLFPEEAVAFGGGRNIVNVALVDMRAWDTLGEISVLLAAATGIASLIFLGRRSHETTTGEIPDSTGLIGGSDPDPMAALRSRPPRSDEGRTPGHRQWLVAGATLAPQRRSVILEVATRFLYHPMLVFSIFLLFSGHNAPGGGFAAGLVTGIALILRYLAGGRYELSAAAPLQAGVSLGTGLFLSAAMGVAAIMFGGDVLQSVIIEGTLPLFGEFKLVTSVFFDLGVYLVVLGLMLDILRSLGAEIDRQGELSGLDSELVGPALEPARPSRRPTK